MSTEARRDAGMVTAELAVAIPVVVFVLLICLAGLSAAIDQVRCVDAARAGSRAAARGDPLAEVHQLAQRAAPEGAVISVSRRGGDALVTVRARAGGWGGVVPTWTVTAAGRTPVEQAGR
ncbi:TadE family type IV pilus minor pilin [Intrasporangium sp. DVR]|uniref:TadE family type IV pilus minor pilin n=1 Tax=Intrasporangium sp. DVR TaxID=3127867 RepID=UPI00313A6777